MPSHEEVRLSPFSVDQMFSMVADIEKYPEFVPGCAALRIIDREFDKGVETINAEMLVSFGALREIYTSKVTLDKKKSVIAACHVDGPFDNLDTKWRFVPIELGSEVHFFIDFKFRSRVLTKASSLVFDAMARKTTDAFAARAENLYGGLHHAQQ
jgi:coenzyme Q-binding protein COQ10